MYLLAGKEMRFKFRLKRSDRRPDHATNQAVSSKLSGRRLRIKARQQNVLRRNRGIFSLRRLAKYDDYDAED